MPPTRRWRNSPPTPTYTTTVSGKVITPARAADPTKGSIITTARVWASTDPTKKIAVGADGSYSLQVAGHSGSFTITAEYTATGNKNYKTSTTEDGHEVGRGITSGTARNAVITVDHPGRMPITASNTGYTSDSSPRMTTANTTNIIMSLNSASP